MKRQDFDIRGTSLVRYLGHDKTVIVPEGITKLDSAAFIWRKHIVEVVLPDTVEKISFQAFQGCENLQSVNIPSKINQIEDEVFSNCKSLKKITLPEGITKIWHEAFMNCESLGEVYLPKSISRIERTAFLGTPFLAKQKNGFFIAGDDILFQYCGTEKTVFIPHGVKKLSACIFQRIEKESTEPEVIHIPETVTAMESSVFEYCHHIKEISVDENNPCYCSIDGSLYSKDRKTLFCYATKEPKKVFRVPDFVETIMSFAYHHLYQPETLIVSKSVQNIKFCYERIPTKKVIFEGRHNDYTISIEDDLKPYLQFRNFSGFLRCLDMPCRKNLMKMGSENYQYSVPLAITLFREDPNNFEALGIRRFLDCYIHQFKYDKYDFILSNEWVIELFLQMLDAEILNEKRFNRIFETVLEKMETANEFAVLITPLLEYKNQHFGYSDPAEHFKL